MEDWMDSAIAEVAKEHLDLDSLEAQNSDSADFHNLAVWQIKAALEAAYLQGKRDGVSAGH